MVTDNEATLWTSFRGDSWKRYDNDSIETEAPSYNYLIHNKVRFLAEKPNNGLNHGHVRHWFHMSSMSRHIIYRSIGRI